MALPRQLDDPTPQPFGEGSVLLPVFVGGGGDNLLCGECYFMLAQCVELENLRNRNLICPRCARECVIPRVGDLRALGQGDSTFSSPDRNAEGFRRAGDTPVVLSEADRGILSEDSTLEN